LNLLLKIICTTNEHCNYLTLIKFIEIEII
jgi:hypothetical protein